MAKGRLRDTSSTDQAINVIEKDHVLSQRGGRSTQRDERILAIRNEEITGGEHLLDQGGGDPCLAHHGRPDQQHWLARGQISAYLVFDVTAYVGKADHRPVNSCFRVRHLAACQVPIAAGPPPASCSKVNLSRSRAY